MPAGRLGRVLFVLGTLCGIAANASAQRSSPPCFEPDALVTISGTLEQGTCPVHPNDESVAAGDPAEPLPPWARTSSQWIWGVHASSVYPVAGHLAFFPRAQGNRHGYGGFFLSLEPGWGGGRAGIGLGNVSYGTFFIRLAALRTWGSPQSVAAGQTFIGPDIRIGTGLSFGAGWYKRVSGSAPGDGSVWLFSGGFGF